MNEQSKEFKALKDLAQKITILNSVDNALVSIARVKEMDSEKDKKEMFEFVLYGLVNDLITKCNDNQITFITNRLKEDTEIIKGIWD